MSAIATAFAWRRNLNMTNQLVLLALAEVADDRHCAAPTRELLMEMTGGSETTIRRSIRDLIEAGLIVIDGEEIREDDKKQNRLVPRYLIVLPLAWFEAPQ
jgi:pyocin large subunit-like protein